MNPGGYEGIILMHSCLIITLIEDCQSHYLPQRQQRYLPSNCLSKLVIKLLLLLIIAAKDPFKMFQAIFLIFAS
jgi:hypothetical protein